MNVPPHGARRRLVLVLAIALLVSLVSAQETEAKGKKKKGWWQLGRNGNARWSAPNAHASTVGQIHSAYGRRGGNRADSNPTTVPVIDGDFLFMVQTTEDQLQAREAHGVTRGGGIVVAVLDGGFNLDHPDLVGTVWPWGYDAIDHDWEPTDLGNYRDDDFDGHTDRGVGHGTFVCGMIKLAAPDVQILPIRVRDDEGYGTNAELERGLVFAHQMGADIVNISGEATHGRSEHIARIISDMRAAGVLVVHSAGNGGDYDVSELADYNAALTVGAVDRDDRLAEFSSRTWDPQRAFVFAPGVDLYGPLGKWWNESRGYWSGTSFSTGLVTGAAALVKSTEPWISPRRLTERLREAVDPVRDAYGRLLPHGRINLRKAVSR